MFANTNLSSMPTLYFKIYAGNYSILDPNVIASADGALAVASNQTASQTLRIPESILSTNGYYCAGSNAWVNIADFGASFQTLYLALGYFNNPRFESVASTYQTITHNVEFSVECDFAGSIPKA